MEFWTWKWCVVASGKKWVHQLESFVPCPRFQLGQGMLGISFFRSHSTTPTLTTYAYSHLYKYTYANPTAISIFKDWAGKSSRLTKSPHVLAVDGNVAYHWMHNAIKFQNIRSNEKSNLGPQVLPRAEALVTIGLHALSHVRDKLVHLRSGCWMGQKFGGPVGRPHRGVLRRRVVASPKKIRSEGQIFFFSFLHEAIRSWWAVSESIN